MSNENIPIHLFYVLPLKSEYIRYCRDSHMNIYSFESHPYFIFKAISTQKNDQLDDCATCNIVQQLVHLIWWSFPRNEMVFYMVSSNFPSSVRRNFLYWVKCIHCVDRSRICFTSPMICFLTKLIFIGFTWNNESLFLKCNTQFSVVVQLCGSQFSSIQSFS